MRQDHTLPCLCPTLPWLETSPPDLRKHLWTGLGISEAAFRFFWFVFIFPLSKFPMYWLGIAQGTALAVPWTRKTRPWIQSLASF